MAMKTKLSRQMMTEARRMKKTSRDHLLRRKKIPTGLDGPMLPTHTRKIKKDSRRRIVKLA
jgi:hypothetical protein